MGLLDKLNKAANLTVRDVITKKQQAEEKPAPKKIGERREGDYIYTLFDDGSEVKAKFVESKRAIFVLDADKAPSFTGDRVDLEGGVLSPIDDKERPTLAYVRDGLKLFEVSPRMKSYKEIEEWRGSAVRRCIAERNEGNYGPYYNVWMYFAEKAE